MSAKRCGTGVIRTYEKLRRYRDNIPDNDAIIGRDDHTVTAPDTNPAPNPANEPAGDLPGASMDRMLRNGRVHDRDGDLLDGENSVTPGADRW